MFGYFVQIKERLYSLVTRTVTAKSEEKNIQDDNFIPSSGSVELRGLYSVTYKV